MKKLTLTLVLGVGLLVYGCATAPAYKTLATVGKATDSAYKAYLDLVVTGRVKTNAVPRIGTLYNEYQAAYGVALALAQFNPKSAPDTNTIARAIAVAQEIALEKSGGIR